MMSYPARVTAGASTQCVATEVGENWDSHHTQARVVRSYWLAHTIHSFPPHLD